MKFLYFLFLLFSIVPLYSQDTFDIHEIRRKQLRLQNDSLNLDHSRMHQDLKTTKATNSEDLMKSGAFPYPFYDSIYLNSFNGLITSGSPGFELNGKKIMFSNFFERKNILNKHKFKNKQSTDRLFFSIVTVVDTIDNINYSTSQSTISSRNHPDYIAQGIFRLKHDTINYIAFTTMEKNDFAIVNMKLFNLKFGNIILIAPQKDGTIRSMQMPTEEQDSESIIKYLKNLFKDEEVVAFLTNKNVL